MAGWSKRPGSFRRRPSLPRFRRGNQTPASFSRSKPEPPKIKVPELLNIPTEGQPERDIAGTISYRQKTTEALRWMSRSHEQQRQFNQAKLDAYERDKIEQNGLPIGKIRVAYLKHQLGVPGVANGSEQLRQALWYHQQKPDGIINPTINGGDFDRFVGAIYGQEEQYRYLLGTPSSDRIVRPLTPDEQREKDLSTPFVVPNPAEPIIDNDGDGLHDVKPVQTGVLVGPSGNETVTKEVPKRETSPETNQTALDTIASKLASFQKHDMSGGDYLVLENTERVRIDLSSLVDAFDSSGLTFDTIPDYTPGEQVYDLIRIKKSESATSDVFDQLLESIESTNQEKKAEQEKKQRLEEARLQQERERVSRERREKMEAIAKNLVDHLGNFEQEHKTPESIALRNVYMPNTAYPDFVSKIKEKGTSDILAISYTPKDNEEDVRYIDLHLVIQNKSMDVDVFEAMMNDIQDTLQVSLDEEDIELFQKFGETMSVFIKGEKWNVTKNKDGYKLTYKKTGPHFGKYFTLSRGALQGFLDDSQNQTGFLPPEVRLKDYISGQMNVAFINS